MSDLLVMSSSEDRTVENADWVEFSALLSSSGQFSREDFARAYHRAKNISQDTARRHADEVFHELHDRHDACRYDEDAPELTSYPYAFSNDNQLLIVRDADDESALLYKFLLAVTRADMSAEERSANGIDPTAVFERLCADVLRGFWGIGSYSDAFVFGTAAQTTSTQFSEKINTLCSLVADGDGWKVGARAPRGGDGGLDVAVYRKFADGRSGGLIGFAQCKTGDNWRKHRTSLVPRAFCRGYMVQPLIIDPFRIYMVPARVSHRRWDEDTGLAGLLFDRCRIMQFGTRIGDDTLRECSTWFAALMQRLNDN